MLTQPISSLLSLQNLTLFGVAANPATSLYAPVSLSVKGGRGWVPNGNSVQVERREVHPVLGAQLVLRKRVCHPTRLEKQRPPPPPPPPNGCLSLGNIFIGSEITGLRRGGTGTELMRAARGSAPGGRHAVWGAPSQQRLGLWHSAPGLTSAGLARWPPGRRAPPFQLQEL